jgi:uncharacterized membrane protein YedE/YeeE
MKRVPWQLALSALFAGALFGAGLVVSGMTEPAKVIGFLDVFGSWDPSLALVMVGAIGVHALAYRAIRKRPAPVIAESFERPPARPVDARLIGGAALFGVGWGLGGYCPGPSIVALGSLAPGVIVFVVGLVVGSLLAGNRRSQADATDESVAPDSGLLESERLPLADDRALGA